MAESSIGAEKLYDEFQGVSPQRSKFIGKVAWDSPRYLEFLDQQQAELTNDNDLIWGGYELHEVYGEREYIRLGLDDDGKSSEAIAESIKYAIEELVETLEDPELTLEARKIVAWHTFQAMRLGELGSGPTNHGLEDVINDVKALDLVGAETLMLAHTQLQRKRQREFQPEAKKLKAFFIEAFGRAMDSGDLPPDIDLERVKDRVQRLILVEGDPLLIDQSFDGEYSLISHSTCVITEEMLKARTVVVEAKENSGRTHRSVSVHEVFHGLSGATIQERLGEFGPAMEHLGGGLRYAKHRSKRQDLLDREEATDPRELPYRGTRFRWLDEAMTEILTAKLTKDPEVLGYVKEIEILKLLMAKGNQPIPEDLFVKAYLEDYDVDKSYGQRIPAWKALRKAIKEAYDSTFLIELDNMISGYRDEGVGLNYLRNLKAGEYGKDGENLKAFRLRMAVRFALKPGASWGDIARADEERHGIPSRGLANLAQQG